MEAERKQTEPTLYIIMRKNYLLLMLSFFVTVASWGTQDRSVLVIELKNGSSFAYHLYQVPKVILEEDKVQIKAYDYDSDVASPQDYSYEVENVKKFYFKPYFPNAIEEVQPEEKRIRVTHLDANQVIISGTEASDHVTLYSLDGRRVEEGISSAEGKTQVNLQALERGIYLIRVNKHVSFKICKP